MPEFNTKHFVPEATPALNAEKAAYWLDKAVKLEGEGKSDKMVSMALDKAHDYEKAALNY